MHFHAVLHWTRANRPPFSSLSTRPDTLSHGVGVDNLPGQAPEIVHPQKEVQRANSQALSRSNHGDAVVWGTIFRRRSDLSIPEVASSGAEASLRSDGNGGSCLAAALLHRSPATAL